MQSVPTMQVCPCFFLQAPAALHEVPPVHVSSSALATVAQVPVALAQVWHVPLQAVLQQTLSTHSVDVHSPPEAQVTPFPFVAVQAPPAQKKPATQSAVVVHEPRHTVAPD